LIELRRKFISNDKEGSRLNNELKEGFRSVLITFPIESKSLKWS